MIMTIGAIIFIIYEIYKISIPKNFDQFKSSFMKDCIAICYFLWVIFGIFDPKLQSSSLLILLLCFLQPLIISSRIMQIIDSVICIILIGKNIDLADLFPISTMVQLFTKILIKFLY